MRSFTGVLSEERSSLLRSVHLSHPLPPSSLSCGYTQGSSSTTVGCLFFYTATLPHN